MTRTIAFGALMAVVLGLPNPACAQDKFLDIDGVRIHYVDQGEGIPVLLVHGFSVNLEWNWKQSGIIDGLVESGFRAVAFDNRGHGKSDKPHDPALYGMEMVRDIERLLDHLEIERAHLVGYSMGARLVNRYRADHPERFLTATLGGYGWGRASTPFTRDDIQKFMSTRENPGDFDVDALAANRIRADVWELDQDELRQNNIPTLIVVGDEDSRLANSKAMISLMPRSRLIVVNGTHMTAPKDPMLLAELVSFLEGQD